MGEALSVHSRMFIGAPLDTDPSIANVKATTNQQNHDTRNEQTRFRWKVEFAQAGRWKATTKMITNVKAEPNGCSALLLEQAVMVFGHQIVYTTAVGDSLRLNARLEYGAFLGNGQLEEQRVVVQGTKFEDREFYAVVVVLHNHSMSIPRMAAGHEIQSQFSWPMTSADVLNILTASPSSQGLILMVTLARSSA
jgi:hypothetical protein